MGNLIRFREIHNGIVKCYTNPMKSSRDILNAALKEDNLPYRIEEFETSKMINGKKKKFKAAWRIATHDWNVS